jgi:hypothetical protein
MAAKGQPLADRRSGRPGGVHGSARYEHRERRAALHGRQSRRQHGPEYVGPDVVPRLERHRAAHHRMVRDPARPQAILPDLSRGVHAELLAVWGRSQPGSHDRVSDSARRGGRGAAADGAGNSGRHVSAATTRLRVRALRHHGGGRPHSRAHPRWLDHGQLRLALDLSDQPAGRDRGIAADLSPTTSASRCSS